MKLCEIEQKSKRNLEMACRHLEAAQQCISLAENNPNLEGNIDLIGTQYIVVQASSVLCQTVSDIDQRLSFARA
jgi:hypothetical protein